MSRGEEPLDVQAVAVLRGHPGSRWTLRYTVRPRKGGSATSTLIAKVYARDRSDIARTLVTLRERGLGSGQPMQVNAPVAYLPVHRVLLLEHAPGETARAALRRGQDGVGDKAARWLAALHAVPAPLPVGYRLRDPLAKARRWARVLDADAPPALARAGHRLFVALAGAQPPWPPATPRIVHGDFGASHVYLAGEVTTVIDWDAWRIGDGAEDAGRFLASLHRIAARNPERGGVVAREVRAFAHAFPADRHGLAFYESLECLRRATLLIKSGEQRRVRDAELLIAAGEWALETGH